MERITLCSNDRNYIKICHVCLSRDRQLFSVEKYAEIFQNICLNKLLAQPLLCWECAAMLRKIKQFKDRAELSTKILKKYLNGQYHNIDTLSNLRTSEINTIVINAIFKREETDVHIKLEDVVGSHFEEHAQNYKHAQNDEQPQKPITNCSLDENISQIDIKQELNFDDDGFDHEDNTNNFENFEGNLSEKSPLTNKGADKKKPIKQYRMISNNMNDSNSLVRKIHLNSDEVKSYMVKESLNKLYTDNEFKCKWCVCSWKNEKKLLLHNYKYHSKTSGKYQCDICLSRFIRKSNLILHIRRHLTILECCLCSYRSYRTMKKHLKSHYRIVECLKCKATFSNIYLFYQHHKDLHVMFVCDICGKKSRSKKTLENHISRHHETYECKLCDRRYKTKATFKRHQDEKHSPASESDYCVQCDKRFANPAVFRRHISRSAAHAAERDGDSTSNKVPCPVCGRLYSRKVYMTNHYKHVHMKQSKYQCEHCNKHFLNRTRYLDHVRSNHEGVKKEKNKLCNICGRGFAENRTLVNHIRTHSGERPFECDYCDARFTQKHAMLSHVNHIHLKKKRPKCWQYERRAGAPPSPGASVGAPTPSKTRGAPPVVLRPPELH